MDYDLRARTTLVCGALLLAIAISTLLRGRLKRVHWLFAAFAADVGFWFLSQSLFGFFQAAVWGRLRVVLAVLLPVFACNLFEAMVPADKGDRPSRMGRLSVLLAIPPLAFALSPYLQLAIVRVGTFLYAVGVIAAGLYELGQRGVRSRSRATQRRVRLLVVIGALAGIATVADFAWVIGWVAAYDPPPVGVVLSVVFLFMLAQALRHDRLLDLYEMVGRLLVATAVAFVIAGLFYVLVTVVGQFNTMYLNAIIVAIVVLVLFNPLREKVEQQIQRFVFRERRKLEASLTMARRRLAHTLEVDRLGEVVMNALERSRAVTDGALYLRTEDGRAFELFASMGGRTAPHLIEVATATPLLELLEKGAVVVEQLESSAREQGEVGAEGALAAAEVLGELRASVVLGARAEGGELIGLLVVLDDRVRDAFSPEDVTLMEALAAQIGVVVENSRVYAKMKERDRLAVLGQMAAGLAHEIRNPLGAIKGAAQLLADPAPDGGELDDTAREFLGIILEEVERLDGVVGSVLDLARQNPGTVVPIDINGEVRRTIQVLSTEPALGQATLAQELADDLPFCSIAPDQLRQVLLNLIRNAVEATDRQGCVTISTRLRQRAGERLVEITVSDDGPGIGPAALKNIFLPFFTTKEAGTGLGLAISQRIVQTAGGRIEVRSREGEGTAFAVVLPTTLEALGTPKPSRASGAPSAA